MDSATVATEILAAPLLQRRRKDFGSGGTLYGVSLVGARGRAHPDVGEFSKF